MRRGARRTPTVMQMEATECGAASLTIILHHFGRWLTLEDVRAQCAVSRDGSSALNIVKAARDNGLEVRAQRLEPHHLAQAQLPGIAHWGMNHFVVVEGVAPDGILINDPAEGPRKVSAEDFDQSFSGVFLSMQPGEAFERTGRRWSVVQALRRRLAGVEDGVGYTLLVSLALVFPGLLVPVFSQIFVDQILINRYGGWLGPLLWGMLGVALLTGVLTWLQREALLRLETRLASEGSVRFVNHLLRLPIAFFGQRHAGQLSARVGLNDRVAQLGAGDLGQILLNMVTASIYLLGMAFYAGWLTLVVVVMASLNGFVMQAQARAMADDNRRLLVATSVEGGLARQGLKMIESYKAMGQEDLLRRRLVALNMRVLNLRQQLGVAQAKLQAFAPFISLTCAAIVLAIGAIMVIDGRMSLGMLVAFQALMAGFFAPVTRLVQLGGRIRDGEAYLRAIDDSLDHPVDPEFAGTETSPMRRIAGAVAVKELSFRYGPAAPSLLKDISFSLQPGERLALVGASGSGKSTLGRLIAGLLEPSEGAVEIDGVALRAVPRTLLRRSIAVVEQQAMLFGGSVRDNITLWDDSMP